jgi:hypothetical protein
MQATILPPRNPALCAPITTNRDLGSCLIANLPMRDLLEADLSRAGFQLVDRKQAGPRTLRIPIDNWIELGALLLLGRNPQPARLLDPLGNVLAWKGSSKPEDCAGKIVTDADCFPVIYPWDLLRMNEEVLAEAFRLGVHEFIEKPIVTDDIEEALTRVIKRRRLADPAVK